MKVLEFPNILLRSPVNSPARYGQFIQSLLVPGLKAEINFFTGWAQKEENVWKRMTLIPTNKRDKDTFVTFVLGWLVIFTDRKPKPHPAFHGGRISALEMPELSFPGDDLSMLKMQKWDNLYLRLKYSSLNVCIPPLSDSVDHY